MREGRHRRALPEVAADMVSYRAAAKAAGLFRRTTTQDSSVRSPRQHALRPSPSVAHHRTARPDMPASGQRPLTALLAPCLADRSTFSSTDLSLASSPIDGLQVGEAGEPSSGSRSSSTCTAGQRKKTPASATRRACDGAACVCDVRCVACEERRMYQHVLEIVRHGCTLSVM